jgi:hypothetical protein
VNRPPAYLAEPHKPLRAILLGWPTASLPALVLAALASTIFPPEAQPDFKDLGGAAFFALVIFAPAVETVIMGVVLEVLLRVMRPSFAVGLSAIGWGVAHSLQAPAWGLVIWWPFLIFSILWVSWRERGYLWAWLIPASVHALNNLGPTLLLLRNA